MSIDGQRTKWRRNIAENFNRQCRAHERYRQTDGRPMTYSEREREFTFAKNHSTPPLTHSFGMIPSSQNIKLGLKKLNLSYGAEVMSTSSTV